MTLFEYAKANPDLVEQAKRRAELELSGYAESTITLDKAAAMLAWAYLGAHRAGKEGRDLS
jgi:hypothetical protein